MGTFLSCILSPPSDKHSFLQDGLPHGQRAARGSTLDVYYNSPSPAFCGSGPGFLNYQEQN